MKFSTKLFALVLSIVMILGVFSLTSCNADNPAKDNEKIKIGLTGPLTGGASIYGIAVKNAAKLAVDEINAAGGLDGIKFDFVMLDDKHDATTVENLYAELYEGGMQVSLGTVTTAPGLNYKSFANEDNVFFLTPSASGDKIPEFDNGFQMCFADGNQGKVAAEYVNGVYKNDTIGIFYKSDDPYSNGIYKQFKENLDSSVKTVEAVFTDANATDFSAQITTLKDCKFIFMPIYYQPASIFMTQAKSTVAADAIYYGCDGFDGLAGQLDLSTITQEVSMLSHFDSNATEGAAADFVKKYTEKYKAETLNQFGASAYDCVYAIYNAMKAAKDAGKKIDVTISASDLSDILKEQFTGDFTYSGVTGTDISWEDNGYVVKGAVKYDLKKAD